MREGPRSKKGAGGGLYQRSLKPRRASEWLSDRVYRPLAHRLVLALLGTGVRPEALVLLQGAVGLVAAGLLYLREDPLAALLLLLRNVLDNADGQLARARGLESQLGRYLDTEVDLLTNAALFAALGARSGAWLAALWAFFLLVALLSADYALNSPKALPRARGAEPWASRLEAFYRAFFAPQDAFFARVFAPGASPAARAFFANFGLSTQHTLLAGLALLGRPEAYLGAVFLLAGLALLVYLYGVWNTPSPPSPPSR